MGMDNGFVAPRMETIKKTAEIFGLPVHFVRQKVLSGEIVAVRAGRKFLVNVESVSAFLSTGVPQGTVADSHSSDKENAPRTAPISLR